VKKKKVNLDYIDPDVAYLIGMIVARGTFHQDGDVRRLVIRFPYRHEAMTPIPGSKVSLDRETALRLGLDGIRARISELLEVDVRVERKAREVSLYAVFPKETIGWRDLRFITDRKTNYLEFEVPEIIFDADIDIRKEFLRGVADTSCEPSYADRDQQERQRIVIQVQFGNWVLPVQLCRFLQEYMGVPVSNVLWGHPNIRAPRGTGWAKETRIRIFADAFVPIGFNFGYKQQIFEEMVEFNLERGFPEARACNPKMKKIRKRKPRHPDENSSRLPECLQRHFNKFHKVCQAMGCKQGKKDPQQTMFEVDDE